ncbi:MAG TPA: type II secretion system F family protein [Candidatus Paceibacterota bacterium]|nr:type II secretion system F family protein [Candidatus Paceibacterota bacterium]
MKFKYQAKTREGENQVGVVEATDKEMAANILTGHNLFVIGLEEAGKASWLEKTVNYFFNRVKESELVIFTRQLAILLEARVPLNTALKTLHEQTPNLVLKEALLQIFEDVDAGLPFSQAVERQPEIFSTFFSSMTRSAEVTGNLESVMGFLADHIEREYALKQKAKSAMIYPIILFILFSVVSMILVIFVIPQIGPIFSEAGVSLPLFTMILIGISSFTVQWWPVLIFAALGIFLMLADYLQTPEGRSLKDQLKVTLPIFKRIFLPVTITRIANSGYMLLKGGIPVVQTIEILADTSDNAVYKEILHKMADDVRQGETLSSSAAKYPEYFPSLVTQMIIVGEAAGQLEQTFMRISTFYGREADASINNIVELIQPVLIVGVGILVGLLFASILMPIYQLMGTIH